MALSKIMALQATDASRRAALQLAFQLPENIEEARGVLHDTRYLLENFLIIGPREVVQPPPIQLQPRASRPLSVARILLLTVPGAGIFGLLAALAAYASGQEMGSSFVLAVGVVLATLVLGRRSGALFALLGVVSHNLLVVPPVLEFSAPTFPEFLRLAGLLALVLVLPTAAACASPLREMCQRFGRSWCLFC
ncbi:hypothetical protein [Bradyrhizobium lablabi]|uniref:hypothetical protein n=1 Tax=Bradyrhizobium lablabi TaxID=722472 RepID=UPI001BA691DB|nr:hypothetical protein [Bradyrhizobium lablabi]MBR0695979.1 hypothetical protein [Bradyrhizobium lablabi]